jgi:CRISPR type III-B/RAMP module RAMP protein Cmr6
MLATLQPVADALGERRCSASWNLHLDKLSFRRGGEDDAKKQSLDAIQSSYRDVRTQAHLTRACRQQASLRELLIAKHGADYQEVSLINSTRLIVHLGRSSALENVGLATERSTGLPIIPGTAVKGILSTWACWEANVLPGDVLPETISEANQDRSIFRGAALRILGSNAESGSTEAGELVFLGGFPSSPPKLVIDILTPHEGAKPKPNPFLALAPGTRWIFPIIAKPRSGTGESLLQQAVNWLTEALTQIGLGAKTAASYGRFRTLTTLEDHELQAHRQGLLLESTLKRATEERERVRLEAEAAHRTEKEARAQKRADRLALLSPEERAYAEYVDRISDWTGPAREIAGKPEEEKQLILKFFRSPQGKALLQSWTNEKGKKRIQILKDAGL